MRLRGNSLYGICITWRSERYACLNWSNGNYFQRDKIHFTQEGYILQGLLLHEAIIKSYNNYVETQLDGTWN